MGQIVLLGHLLDSHYEMSPRDAAEAQKSGGLSLTVSLVGAHRADAHVVPEIVSIRVRVDECWSKVA